MLSVEYVHVLLGICFQLSSFSCTLGYDFSWYDISRPAPKLGG